MRNINWTIIALVVLAAAGVFYFMRQSDVMKTQEAATAAAEVATSMDADLGEGEELTEEEEMIGEPENEDAESVIEFAEEEVD